MIRPSTEVARTDGVADRPAANHRVRIGRRKRVFDVAVVVATAPLTVPVMVALAIAVRLGSPGPALFRQTRIGQNGKPFTILKFRTMDVDAVGRLHRDAELYAE